MQYDTMHRCLEKGESDRAEDGARHDSVATPSDSSIVKHCYQQSDLALACKKGGILLVVSHTRCRTPLRLWKANGAAMIVFPVYLAHSGNECTKSMICPDSIGIPTTGPAR